MRPNPRFTLKATVAATLCALSAVPPALADGAAGDEKPQTVETMVVTAQKREQMAIDVPASVSTVSAERLQQSGAVRFEDYVALVPGMTITAQSRGFSSVVLRGISTGIAQAIPSTAYYIDEAPVGSITAYARGSTVTPDLDPFDLRRIEVLKGPQGTLYGAGAVGGLLRYVTVPPDSTKFGGAVSLGGNNVAHGGNGYEGRVALNIPLVKDSMALRVSAFERQDAGYIDDPTRGLTDVNEAKTRGGRVAFGWSIAPDWSLLATAQTQRFRTDGIGVDDRNGPSLTPVTNELEHGSSVAEKQETDLDVFNATIKGRVGTFDLVSSTTYQKVRGETTVDATRTLGAAFGAALRIPNLGAQTHQIVNTERWAEEVRARSSAFGDKLNYEIGLFYTKEESTNRLPPEGLFLTPGLEPIPPLPPALAAFNGPLFDAMLGVQYKEYSLFGNATYSFTPQLDVTAGVRFSHDKQHFDQNYAKSIAVPTPVVFSQDVTNSTTTGLLNAIYKLDRDTALYGRVASGYRPGGPSALPASIGQPYFDPDSLVSYEVGYKAVFADGKASLETAVFTTDWKDIQVQKATVSGGTTYQHFVNAGTARSRGAEGTLLVFPMSGLTLRATGAYTDSRLTEDAAVVGGLDGDRMPFVPKWTASLGADYRFPLAGMQAWVGGVVGYIGERRSNFSQQPNVLDVPSYTTLGLNAGVDIGNVRISLYGKNLTDERGINHVSPIGRVTAANPVGNPYAAGVIQPRTIGTDVTYTF